MTVSGVAYNGIVLELLTNDNYERWSVLIKNYLTGHGLWDVVLSPPEWDNEEWQKKNAMALYAIQLSCGPYAFPEVQGEPDDGVGEEDRNDDELFKVNGNIKKLYEHLKKGKWEAARSCIDQDLNIPILQSSRSSGEAAQSCIDQDTNIPLLQSSRSSGRTILHIAFMDDDKSLTNSRREEIVESLIDLVSEKEQLLEKQENYATQLLLLRLHILTAKGSQSAWLATVKTY
ncbi:hypothetical protein L6164_028836 [Bauhinia variegata]|uniref:Uncharacterized protein n=1 Tax=Bauhinia variegata TaxID=167791 RepID=A0ACB9L6W4_BAUVA|nr:hypothetical protein L6164_028836 [Bauhinia variegata]